MRVLRPAPPVHLTPASTDPATAAEWFGRFEGAGLDGVVAKRLEDPYQPDKRALVKVKHERTAECAVAGYRIHKDGNGVGSLLLGLYDDEGHLQHVGVAASFSVKFRAELLAELEPLTHDAVDDHPWRRLGRVAAHRRGPQAGGDEPLERRQGPLVGADPRRARRRGDVRPAREAALPPRRVVRPLAPRPHAGELSLRAARRRRAGAVRGARQPVVSRAPAATVVRRRRVVTAGALGVGAISGVVDLAVGRQHVERRRRVGEAAGRRRRARPASSTPRRPTAAGSSVGDTAMPGRVSGIGCSMIALVGPVGGTNRTVSPVTSPVVGPRSSTRSWFRPTRLGLTLTVRSRPVVGSTNVSTTA